MCIDFIKRLGYFAATAMLCLNITACGEEEVPVEVGPQYTETSILFTYDYSGKVYSLVDLTHEVVFGEGTEPAPFVSNESEGQITVSFTGVKPLSTISVKVIATRNDVAVDMAEGIAYDRRDTPRFSIARHFDDGSIESGGEIHSGSTNATGLDKASLEEYISENCTREFTVSLDEEGRLIRNQIN